MDERNIVMLAKQPNHLFCFVGAKQAMIDKNTGQIGIFDCSQDFYKTGADKAEKASEIYDLFYKNEDFDPNNYFINKTL